MNIATWSIGSGFIADEETNLYSKENLQYFINTIKAENPDILFLQEVDTNPNNPPDNQATMIANALGYEVTSSVLHPNHLKAGRMQSLAILSRYPLQASWLSLLPNPHITHTTESGIEMVAFDKGFLAAQVEIDSTIVQVICGHFLPFHKFKRDWMEDEFKHIRCAVDATMGSFTTRPTICGIDMNYAQAADLAPSAMGSDYKELIDQPTIPEGWQSDHLIVSKEMRAHNSRVIPGQADHYLCVAEIGL